MLNGKQMNSEWNILLKSDMMHIRWHCFLIRWKDSLPELLVLNYLNSYPPIQTPVIVMYQ